MTVASIDTDLVRLPVSPVINPGGALEVAWLGCVCVTIRGVDGDAGEGLAYTLNGRGLTAIASLIDELAERLVGHETAAGKLDAEIAKLAGFYGYSGIVLSARAALEQALWDLRAKQLEVSVTDLLGRRATSLPVYYSGGLWADSPIDEIGAAAQAAVTRGFRGLKMRLGGSVKDSVERVGVVREVIGRDVALMVDSNQRWSRGQAIRLGRALEEFELTWFEEPIHHRDHSGEAAIRSAISIPLATGETLWGSKQIDELVNVGAADYVTPDLQRMGGPNTFVSVARRLQECKIPIASHLSHEMNAALLLGLPNAAWLEYMPWFEDIYEQRLQLDQAGNAVAPTTTGWGFTFDRAAIKRLRLR